MRLAVLLCLLSTGCFVPKFYKSFDSAGKESFVVDCYVPQPVGPSAPPPECFSKAAELCPTGYSTLAMTQAGATEGSFLWQGAVFLRTLTIQCKGAEAAPAT